LAIDRRLRPARPYDVEQGLRQMAVMLRSGLTLLESLQTVAEQAERSAAAAMWAGVAQRIQRGASLSEALAEHPRFDRLLRRLVEVGERTGTLEPIFERAAQAQESRRTLMKQVLTALTYPAIVTVAALGISVFLVVVVIPKLQRFLTSMNRSLPWMTQALVDVSTWLRVNGPALLILAVSLTAAAWVVYRWEPGRLALDRSLLRLPVLGRVFKLAGTALIARNLALLIRSGITIAEAMTTAATLPRNRYAARSLDEARQRLIDGGDLAGGLRRSAAFTPMLARMSAVGESAGTLEEVLEEVARFHEQSLESAIRVLAALVEPAIIAVVGGIVGFVYVSFFMALFAAGGASF
jgi:type IV pilus assembly protein PilC